MKEMVETLGHGIQPEDKPVVLIEVGGVQRLLPFEEDNLVTGGIYNFPGEDNTLVISLLLTATSKE